MKSHYLDSEIARMKVLCQSVTDEGHGSVLYSGQHGRARVAGKKVYFFEPYDSVADESFTLKSNRHATLSALEWVCNGRV